MAEYGLSNKQGLSSQSKIGTDRLSSIAASHKRALYFSEYLAPGRAVGW
jgi:hypothetical protein